MSILHKMFGKSFRLLSIVIVVVLITAICTAPVAAITPTGPFTLDYTAGVGGSIIGTTPQTVALDGSGSAIEAVPDMGYHFADWSDGSTVNPRTDTNVTGDIFVTANFAMNTYNLNYYAGSNGSLMGEPWQSVNYGEDGSAVEAVPDTGYHFVDWSDGPTDNPRTDYDVTGDIDVTANFATNTLSLEYEAGSNGSLSGETWQAVDYGTSGSPVIAIPDDGYHFAGWSDGSTENPRTDANVTDNLYVTANFSINIFTLSYTAGANGSLTGDTTQTVDYEANGTMVTAIADAGYQFVGWSDGSTDNPRTDTYITNDVQVTAFFAFLYTVSFNTQGGSAVSDQLVIAGGKVDYPDAPTKTGLYFAGWYKEPSCDNIWHSNVDVVSGNTTLYARWNGTAPKVAVFYGDNMGNDIQTKLISTGLFSQVDMLPVDGATPTLAELKQYNAVFIYTNTNHYADPVAWGNVLADYADDGGGVVLALFTLVVPGGEMGIDGRISTDGYLPFTQAPQSGGYNLTLVADVASDPILNGVNSFDGGTSSYLCTVNLTPDATLIAHWSNGYPLVATKQLTAGRIVGLNLFPPSTDAGRSDYWDSSTDGALLMANSLAWASSTGVTLSPPTITSNGGGDMASVDADENQTAVTTVTATDPDSTTFTYSISGGLDGGLFSIDPSSGVLTFKAAPDFESPIDYLKNNVYQVIVQVSDGGLRDIQEINVTVSNITIEAPIITSDGGGVTATVDVKEKQTAVTMVTAKDDDSATLAYRISGGADAALFSMDPSSGALTFKAAPDFETKSDNNADGIYEVTVEVSDGTLTDTQAIRITVTLLTPLDLLNNLESDIYTLKNEGQISNSTANGLLRTIDKVFVKINAGDTAGAVKLLNALKTTINRQIPRKIPAGDLVAQIDQIIIRINS